MSFIMIQAPTMFCSSIKENIKYCNSAAEVKKNNGEKKSLQNTIFGSWMEVTSKEMRKTKRA